MQYQLLIINMCKCSMYSTYVIFLNNYITTKNKSFVNTRCFLFSLVDNVPMM